MRALRLLPACLVLLLASAAHAQTPTLAIAGKSVVEGDSGTQNVVFTVTLTGTTTLPVTVHWATANGTATTAATDYVAASGDLTFTPPAKTKTLTVVVNGDTLVEADETFKVMLSAPTNATLAVASAVGTITNNDKPSFSITDRTVVEADVAATFTVSLSTAPLTPVTVHWATLNSTAAAPADYTAAAGDLTFAPGVKSQIVTVQVLEDALVEHDEVFKVRLSLPVGATILDGEGVGTITNDDKPTLSVNDRMVTEADVATTFTISLSVAPLSPVSVHWATVNGNAVAPGDYVAGSGDLTFDTGVRTQTVTVQVNADTLVENDETFRVRLSLPVGATIADMDGIGTIVDNDKPSFTVSDRIVTEPDSGTIDATFAVTLSSASPNKVITVSYATVAVTATSGSDYTAISGKLTYQPGERTKTLIVKVKGDGTAEADETFKLRLSLPTNATIAKVDGLGTIKSDDFATVSIGNATVLETDTGAQSVLLTVTVAPAAPETATVHWATANGTATTSNLDYEAASGDLTFAKGQTSKTVTVRVNGDLYIEPDETMFVNLSAPSRLVLGTSKGQITIRNNDTKAVPQLTVNDATIVEGNSGTTNLMFTISLDIPGAAPIAVTYTTANATATAGSDYVATSARVTIPAGTMTRTFLVGVTGDTVPEPDETFVVNLTAPTNSTLKRPQGKGKITNDDLAPPKAPKLTSPSGAVTTRTPTYRWSVATGASEYVLSVNRPSGAVVLSQTFAATAVCVGTACAATPTKSLGDGDHTWWVKARNGAGTSPASDALSFSVSAAADVVSVTSHDDGQSVSARGFLVSGLARHASGITSLHATLDDPLLGRTIDRDIEVAPGSGRFTLWVHDGQITAGDTVTVIFTATRGDAQTDSAVLGLVAQNPDTRPEQMLVRTSFGATPALESLVGSLGADVYLEEQLNPASIDDSALDARLAGVPLNTKEGLQTQTLLRAAYSRRQLQEVLTQFWDNHFNTDINKVGTVSYEVNENSLFRQNALGRFRDLLAVSSASPAMLIYLDNNLSLKGSPNENYARELMELHTLGVDGGYTQNDVNNVAKAFTGWQIQGGAFFFDAADHDTTQKFVLGQTLDAGRGIQDGWDVLDILARHPSTAHFICKKLAQVFVSDTPSTALLDACADRFLTTDGQISEVVRLLLSSPDFDDPSNFRAKVKNPEEFVVSTVRSLGANTTGADLAPAMSPLGMRFFENPVPTGWSETGDDWVSSNTLLERSNFVNKVARATNGPATAFDAKAFFQANGYETSEGIAGFLFQVALGGESTDEERQTALDILSPAGQAPFDITSPQASARIQQLVGTLLSYPGFQFQ